MTEPFISEIKLFAGNYNPRNWAMCNGAILSVSQNQSLFSLLGSTYGGDGRITFGLPDMRGRLPLHFGQGIGLFPRYLGQRLGLETSTLRIEEVPTHTHTLQASLNDATDKEPGGKVVAKPVENFYSNGDPASNEKELNPLVVQNAGGNTSGDTDPHTNVMPYQCLTFIIALKGAYPSRN